MFSREKEPWKTKDRTNAERTAAEAKLLREQKQKYQKDRLRTQKKRQVHFWNYLSVEWKITE